MSGGLAAMLVCAAAAGDLTGSWGIVARLPQYGLTHRIDCAVEQSGASLSGHCSDGAGVTLPIDGEVSGKRVTFGYAVDIGEILKLSFDGERVDDHTLSGRLTIGTAPGQFTATRQ